MTTVQQREKKQRRKYRRIGGDETPEIVASKSAAYENRIAALAYGGYVTPLCLLSSHLSGIMAASGGIIKMAKRRETKIMAKGIKSGEKKRKAACDGIEKKKRRKPKSSTFGGVSTLIIVA